MNRPPAPQVPLNARARRRQAGQSAVEFILVFPILLLIALAVGDFGRIYASGVAVEDAAREAADFAAFDDLSASHFEEPDPVGAPGVIDARDSTRAEAFRRACLAVSSLPGYEPTVAAACQDPTGRCVAAPGSFCQMVVLDNGTMEPFLSTCGVAPQTDMTCGWVVHVTITWDFRTILGSFGPLPGTVNLVRESRFAISALPFGSPPGP